MKLNLNIEKLAELTNGEILKGKGKINSFATDTRKLKKGDIFFALKGNNFDGNDFIKEAIEKGAIGIICEKNRFPKSFLNKVKLAIEVENSLKTLHTIAAYHISRFKIPVISITGSNGKTTTKEMIKYVLSSSGKVCSNFGNFNNQFGLPLSVLELNKKHKYAIFELGASKRGDVAELAKIIKPNISVITTIAPEHLEFFKTMENIFETETEAIDFLKKDGKVVYNGDNIYLKRLKNKNINSFTFGFEKDNELRVEKIKDNFYFNYKAKKIPVKLKNDVEHNYLNAAAAFLVSVLCKIETKKILERLAKFKGVKMRMQEFKLNKNKIIFDAYNANPQSMHSAIESLKKKKPKILILGDMKELGKYSLKYHRELGKYLLKNKFDMAYLIGKEIKETYKVLKDKKENVKYFLSADLAKSEINRILKDKSGFYVLFKASRSMHFENLLDKYGQKKVH